ncbi:transposase family protein [Zoogloea sp.]|uniref:transposase family protein n=1 Tax=Zoogloea sp. TaxID=49181 RepID=UPI0035AFD79F
METPAPMPLMSCLSLIDDPRRAGYARRHDLQEILTMAVCAVLCDMNTFEEIAFWAQSKETWLRRFLKLEGGIPCTGSVCLDTVLQLRLPFAWHKPDGLRGVT